MEGWIAVRAFSSDIEIVNYLRTSDSTNILIPRDLELGVQEYNTQTNKWRGLFTIPNTIAAASGAIFEEKSHKLYMIARKENINSLLMIDFGDPSYKIRRIRICDFGTTQIMWKDGDNIHIICNRYFNDLYMDLHYIYNQKENTYELFNYIEPCISSHSYVDVPNKICWFSQFHMDIQKTFVIRYRYDTKETSIHSHNIRSNKLFNYQIVPHHNKFLLLGGVDISNQQCQNGISLWSPSDCWSGGATSLSTRLPCAGGLVLKFADKYGCDLLYQGWKRAQTFGKNMNVPTYLDKIIILFLNLEIFWVLGHSARTHYKRWSTWQEFDID